jgi:stage V sporulation protein SpoVS
VSTEATPAADRLVFRVRSSTSSTDLGSAVAHGVMGGREVEMRAVGAGAINQAVNAMGTAMAHPGTGSTDGGTLVPRTGMAKSGDPTAGGKANRRNILAERGGPCGGIQVNRHYTGEASAEATTRNVYRLRSAFGAGPEFRSGAGRG